MKVCFDETIDDEKGGFFVGRIVPSRLAAQSVLLDCHPQ
jgi:hypothetical protein